jgi:DNA replication and repair protein RecF
MTLAGPHRDDFDIIGGAVDLHRFGSQGEQRTAAIAMRLGLVHVSAGTIGEPPLLLLDDVLSELDAERRAGLFEGLGAAGQTIVTTTDMDAVPPGVRAAARNLRVVNGLATPIPSGA